MKSATIFLHALTIFSSTNCFLDNLIISLHVSPFILLCFDWLLVLVHRRVCVWVWSCGILIVVFLVTWSVVHICGFNTLKVCFWECDGRISYIWLLVLVEQI